MMTIRILVTLQVFLVVLMIGYVRPVWADSVRGLFTAEKTCPAYVSKNKKTNPDQTQITMGGEYETIEANRSTRPDWYRIIVPSAQPAERWVSADCGRFQVAEINRAVGNTCRIAGQADSHVLALSWQPAFCETKPQKPECNIDDPLSYQARHFTLHGLWPNKQQCGTNYAFCGDVNVQENNFCDYPRVELSTKSETSLAEVMPSVQAGSCLERHEWHKHGTCQADWSEDEYFDLSVDLTRQFNESGMAYFMNRRIGQTVRTEDFLNRLSAVLGPAARDRIKLKCEQGMLVEVQISLTANLKLGDDLETLIEHAPKQIGSSCQETFVIDAIGNQP